MKHKIDYSFHYFAHYLACSLLFVSTVQAKQPKPTTTSLPASYSLRLEVDLPVIVGGATLFGLMSLVTKESNLSLCSPTCDAAQLNSLDRRVTKYNNQSARTTSDVFLIVIPVLAGSLPLLNLKDNGAGAFFTDMMLSAEAVIVTGLLTSVVKAAVQRPRPYMYRGDENDSIRKQAGGDYQSFFSGHTSIAFSATISAAYLFAKRHPNSKWRYVVWSLAIAGAGTVAALRVAGGKHFYTDVITGAAVGTGFGIMIPALHQDNSVKKRQSVHATWTASPRFSGIVGSF